MIFKGYVDSTSLTKTIYFTTYIKTITMTFGFKHIDDFVYGSFLIIPPNMLI